mmetsp:Transcript_65921/g.137648  ORF Transcript_65921/g.137648 Transcript_65921/m.137648 type:complete len:204 (+) Transcript_65921:813-1424(+)
MPTTIRMMPTPNFRLLSPKRSISKPPESMKTKEVHAIKSDIPASVSPTMRFVTEEKTIVTVANGPAWKITFFIGALGSHIIQAGNKMRGPPVPLREDKKAEITPMNHSPTISFHGFWAASRLALSVSVSGGAAFASFAPTVPGASEDSLLSAALSLPSTSFETSSSAATLLRLPTFTSSPASKSLPAEASFGLAATAAAAASR